MAWVKRIALFALTNLAVLLLLSVVTHLLGIDRVLSTQTGINLPALMVFAAIFGMGGSFISLLLSKWMAIHSLGCRVITQPASSAEAWLVDTVAKLARDAGIGMPDVAIYDSPEINAFATGASRDHALVAVSAGLLHSMNQREAQAVLGHEITHIANGDMVTLTLIQGVLNTFVIFLSRIIGMVVDRTVFRNDRGEGYGLGYMLTVIVAQIAFGILATIIVMWFSRWREFRADAGSARLLGPQSMIAALERLKLMQNESHLPQEMRALGIAGGSEGWSRLFLSHPPLDERIAALRNFGG